MQQEQQFNKGAIPTTIKEQLKLKHMEQYASIQQAYKKEPGEERKPVSFTTPIQAVYDGKTGASLEAILAQFNSIYVQYQGTPKDTRLIIPMEMRRAGLTITYMDMESNTITERANSAVQKDNDHWGLDVNWSRVDELSLSGDISVSANGTWIINGKDTGVKALGPKGDTGLTPWLKTIDNKLHFSYDNVTWEPCSENIAAWFRFNATSSDSQVGTIGRIQISRDNKTWTDLSPEFRNYLRVQGYVATTSSLPANQVVGTIYGVGPTYAADDTAHTNPIYRLHVWNGTSWVDNGQFTSIAAGVVQETGDSETEVMSQKAVSKKVIINLKIISSKQAEYENLATNEYSYNPATKKIYFKGVDGFIHSAFPYNTVYRYVDKLLLYGNEGQLVVLDSVIYLSAWSNDATTLLSGGKGSFVYNTYSKSVEMVTDSQLWSFEFNDKTMFVYHEEFYSWDVEHKVLTRLKSIDNLIEAINSIDQKSNIGIQAKNILDEIVVKYVGEEIQNDETYDIIISPSTGKETDYSGAYASGYIPVIGGKEYYLSGSMTWGNAVYAWYDENKAFISGYAAANGSTLTKLVNELVTSPQNAAYIRVCQWTTNQEGKVNEVKISAISEVTASWKGKKWVCVGDSLTEHNSKATMNYHDYVAQATGIEVVNMGVSGTGYKRQEESGNAFYQRVENIPTDADVITIFGSGNDGAYWGSNLGTASDTTTDTIGGCINITIDNIIARMPLAVIGIVSPCPWGSYPPNTDNAMKRYSNLLKEICERRGIPFLNLYLNSGLRPWDETFRELAYSRDNGGSVHPDENGHKLIAPRFKAFLETLIM